ncbi:N-acetylmuramoyl-L-alanine amidase [Thalassobacillus cyri]|uniref:N-acetylmuramoyl-L-alanine amidase n=1 Tax=Thalassobacillus cyri TaxID=571932 RepID=A0A1H4HDT8_9BACI|nr:N-acetylmuramoyl-L-alanine amidase CwlD [Thalassobacillus cyri]SEB19228.1 N-acetylmuramoyl-L-alanine amidase [Thalassobacillus cyri]
MYHRLKVFTWLCGLALLIFLIAYPVQEAKDTWQTWSLPLAGKVIVLDPGHGGVDGGAEGSDNTQEKDIALNISKYLQDYLQQAGALVYLTRSDDRDLAEEGTEGLSRRKSEDIRNRLAFIHEKEPDFFLSIHLNAIPATQWHGAQTFYYPDLEQSENLAKFIQAEIIRNLENTERTALAINGMYLLKHADVPAALVEAGFLSNTHERNLLKKDSYQRKMAASIYEGILRYTSEEEYPEAD